MYSKWFERDRDYYSRERVVARERAAALILEKQAKAREWLAEQPPKKLSQNT